MKRVANNKSAVIVGGGFGGLNAAQHLGNNPVDITLIDRNNYHLFQPLLYQVATGGLSPEDIASPLRAVLSRYKNVRVLRDEVIDIFPEENALLTKKRLIDYDYLILSAGSENTYFGNDLWSEVAPGLKTVDDALQIRDRILSAFEEAEYSHSPSFREAALTFAVVGGGPTGVEMSGALAELANHTLDGDFRRIDPKQSKILLVEGQERILPGYPQQLSQSAQKTLQKLGVEVLTGTMVKSIIDDVLILKHPNGELENIRTRNVIWAAGNRSNPLAEKISSALDLPLDRCGRIQVNNDLTVGDLSNLFVIGDLAGVIDSSGEYLPGVAPVAMQQGKYAAQSILRSIEGKELKPFKYRDMGSMAVIGRHAAVADFGRFGLSGMFAWFLWAVIHIMNLVEFGNRLVVMTQWAWNYLTKKKGARLIGRNPRKKNMAEFSDPKRLRKTA